MQKQFDLMWNLFPHPIIETLNTISLSCLCLEERLNYLHVVQMENCMLESPQISWAETRPSSAASATVVSSELSSTTPPGCWVGATKCLMIHPSNGEQTHFCLHVLGLQWPCSWERLVPYSLLKLKCTPVLTACSAVFSLSHMTYMIYCHGFLKEITE